MKDTYRTIAQPATGSFKDRNSKFFAYAFPVTEEAACQTQLDAVKKEHFKARHHCYAYRLGLDQNNFRANDDGEPSGTAGRPILGQIDHLDLTYVLVVVVRYFGGTKLGTSGLINAYRTAAAAALQQAQIIDKIVEDIYQLEFDYAHLSSVMNIIKKLELEIVQQDFGTSGVLDIAMRQSETRTILQEIRAAVAGVRVAELPEEVAPDGGLQMVYRYTR